LTGCVDEVLEAREGDDVVELAVDVALGEPEDGAVEVDVLATGELDVEAGAELEQRREATLVATLPLLGTQDAGEALQHRALARTVRTDDAEGLPGADLEVDALQRPELLVRRSTPLEDRRLQVLVLLLVEPEALPEVVDDDGGGQTSAHSVSRRGRVSDGRIRARFPWRPRSVALPRRPRHDHPTDLPTA
jgi:hypothetical protein